MSAAGYSPVQRVNTLLLASPPDIEGFLEYFLVNYKKLKRSSESGGQFYSNFHNTCYDCFMPDTVDLLHYNTMTQRCENHGKHGPHQRYRDFLSYIVLNLDSFSKSQKKKIQFLLINILEENGIALICYIDFDQDIYDIFSNYDLEEEGDGNIIFCKGRRLVEQGMSISNTRVHELLSQSRSLSSGTSSSFSSSSSSSSSRRSGTKHRKGTSRWSGGKRKYTRKIRYNKLQNSYK